MTLQYVNIVAITVYFLAFLVSSFVHPGHKIRKLMFIPALMLAAMESLAMKASILEKMANTGKLFAIFYGIPFILFSLNDSAHKRRQKRLDNLYQRRKNIIPPKD